MIDSRQEPEGRTVPIQMHFQGCQSPPHGLNYSALQINDLIKDNVLYAFSYPPN